MSVYSDFKTAYERLLSLGNLRVTQYFDSKAELDASLLRVKSFLKLLKNPQKDLQFIHIAGTSGKGSVTQMLHSILHTSGARVGTHTSPHTTSYLERFHLNGKLTDPVALTKDINKLIKTYETFLKKGGGELSFFELSTCLAFLHFARQKVQWCVLEAGCGGRYDATNVIPTPRVAVITNIGKDHTQLLGDSLASIAKRKAGIIKRRGIVYCGETRPALRDIFMKEAIKHSAALFFVNPPTSELVAPALGTHQQHNAAIARSVATDLGISPDAIDKGLASLTLPPCRFEKVQNNPAIILDGAHSPAKIKAAVRQIQALEKTPHIVFGCTATKDASAMLKLLTPVAASITTTRFETTFRKAANPAELQKLVPTAKRAGAFLDPCDALKNAKKLAKRSGLVVVTGSLYLSGELRSNWMSEREILKRRSSAL